MFEILAEIGEPGNGTLTGQYPPLREMLDVDQEAANQALLDYSKGLPPDRREGHSTCLLVRVGDEPGILAEFLCPIHRSGTNEPGKV